ncbi:MAG TPA: 16S rRNA (uracil(1498)-N(3))-methyltransferase [Kofleriaceae bacterium]|nr:16S rRNA (uracil(1498)-N(3))-methyltransferase [Kofleriaceae bacterium]
MTARLIVAPGRLAAGRLTVDGDDHAYLFRVRRLAVGDAVVVFDGAGREAQSVAIEIGPAHAVLEVEAPRDVPRPPPHITVVQAALKGERMDWCLEKLVEVGVDAITVVETARAVVRLDDERRAKRLVRHQRIAQEAARQCGRADIPPVAAAADLASALRTLTAQVRLVADPASDTPVLTAVPASAASMALVVGPEGGLTADEVAAAVAAGCAPVSLGATILRAETAGAAAVFAIRAVICAGGWPGRISVG